MNPLSHFDTLALMKNLLSRLNKGQRKYTITLRRELKKRIEAIEAARADATDAIQAGAGVEE